MRSASAVLAAMTMPPVLRSMRLQSAGVKECSSRGTPFTLGVEVGLNVVDERLAVFRAVVRVDGLAGLFVDEEDVLILIYNI